MKSPETMFVDAEHEYQVAGWLGTIAVMSEMALGLTPRRDVKGHDLFLLDFCKDIASSENINQKVSGWVGNKAKNEDRIDALNQAGVMQGNSLMMDFSDAYDIYANEEWRDYILKETSFGRLYPIVQELTDFYVPTHIPIGLSYAILKRQRDISFYTGLYDDGF